MDGRAASLDEKIIAIPFQDPTYDTYQGHLGAAGPCRQARSATSSRVYKSLEGKETVVSDVLGPRGKAIEIIIKCQNAYIEKYCR